MLPVLIVGAGPTGLMMACQLLRHNIPFRIIDKNPGTSERSKALALQSRSLEIYDQMDIAADAVEQGHTTRAINFIVRNKRVQRVPLSDVGKKLSPFPYLHIYEQNKNELLLQKFLNDRNVFVEWNSELKELKQSDNEVRAKVLKNASVEEIVSKFLVGSDGGSSSVRHQLGLKFPGDTYQNIFYVVDTAVNWSVGYDELFLYVSRNTFTGFFPMKGEKRFRLVGVLPKGFQDTENLTFDDIEQSIITELEGEIDFYDTRWFSVYRLHHRCVENFRSGRCFLAGDAAHIHSPAGGQGMNTGLQDAYNLAWKIAMIEKKIAGESILESYNEERLPFAQRLVKTTDRVFGFAVSKKPLTRFIRVNILPWFAKVFMRFHWAQMFAFKTISQILITYKNSRLSLNDSKSRKVSAGDRLPYFFISHKSSGLVSVYDLLKSPAFHVLIFSKKSKGPTDELSKMFSMHGLFNILEFEFSSQNSEAYEVMGVNDWMICIVRPDNYIGYLGDNFVPSRINKYFESNYLNTD